MHSSRLPGRILILSESEVSLLLCGNFNAEVREFTKQPSAHAWIPQSPHVQSRNVLSHPSLTFLLSVNQGFEVLRGEDDDGMSQRAGAEFIGPLDSPPTHREYHKFKTL